ncbi:phage integrase N-terminal SAM-like domain-containing protein [Leptothrix cholodnii]|nr:phage integrase N-terminal SAM-like domain-containing protein [Leptothrix cholodnii]
MDPDHSTLPQLVPADAQGVAAEPAAPRLMVRLREALRVRHYSLRTEQAYADWAKRYIRFHGLRHPMEMGSAEVMAFLTYLAAERGVSSSTQSQAKAALLFLYRQVLGIDLPWTGELISAKSTRRLPVVLTPREVEQLLHELNGTMWLVVALLDGTGMRLLEGLRLRVKDIEFVRCSALPTCRPP